MRWCNNSIMHNVIKDRQYFNERTGEHKYSLLGQESQALLRSKHWAMFLYNMERGSEKKFEKLKIDGAIPWWTLKLPNRCFASIYLWTHQFLIPPNIEPVYTYLKHLVECFHSLQPLLHWQANVRPSPPESKRQGGVREERKRIYIYICVCVCVSACVCVCVCDLHY